MKHTKLVNILLVLALILPGVAFAKDASKPGELREKMTEKLRKAFPRAAFGNGKLTAISGSTLTVEKEAKSYTVLTGTFEKCTTKFVRRFGGDSSLSELTVGDKLNIVGRWTDETKTSIEACVIRDLSIEKRRGTFVGEVVSISNVGLVMTTVSEARENQTVTVSTTTKLVNRKEETIALADVKVGHRIRVKGLWNRANNTVTEVTQIKDYNLPEKPEKDEAL